MECFGHEPLHGVLAELGDEAIAHGCGLQFVDGFVQVEFAGLPEQCAGFAARGKDCQRAWPSSDLACGDRQCRLWRLWSSGRSRH